MIIKSPSKIIRREVLNYAAEVATKKLETGSPDTHFDLIKQYYRPLLSEKMITDWLDKNVVKAYVKRQVLPFGQGDSGDIFVPYNNREYILNAKIKSPKNDSYGQTCWSLKRDSISHIYVISKFHKGLNLEIVGMLRPEDINDYMLRGYVQRKSIDLLSYLQKLDDQRNRYEQSLLEDF